MWSRARTTCRIDLYQDLAWYRLVPAPENSGTCAEKVLVLLILFTQVSLEAYDAGCG